MKLPLTQYLLLAHLLFASSAFAEFNDQDALPPLFLQHHHAISISTASQKLSGLQTITLKASRHNTEFNGYGKAIALQPLLTLRNRYKEALIALDLAIATLKKAEQSLKRQQELYENGIAAQRLLQDQQLQWQNAKTQVDATTIQLQAIQEEALLHWGKILTDWVLSNKLGKLDEFLTGKRTLLQVSLPANRSLSADPQNIYIEMSGERSQAQTASLISKAPQNDPNDQGINYFYQISSSTIRAGMKVNAWIPDISQPENGVIIPKSALLWSQEHALVYIKLNAEQFSQRLIDHYAPMNDGYFIAQEIKPGEVIVITGAQMLLSAQLKQQTHSADD